METPIRQLMRDLRTVQSNGPTALAWQVADSVRFRAQARLNFRGRHEFTDRGRGRRQLLLVVAGYRPYLWPYTLSRIERFVPEDVDVCIVVPGIDSPELAARAAANGWSLLSTRRNALALAQNLAIARHPEARYIHKLDEDILVGEGYFTGLLDGLKRVRAEGTFDPGYVAPLINVNGFSYRLFLEELGLEEAYRERFGELRQGLGVRAHGDGEAAFWLWERSIPFDDTVARFAARPFGYTPIPLRFSIGAFVMDRDLWYAIGGFYAHARGGLGHEEQHLCQECTELLRVPVVIHDVLAGHFAFGPQEPFMRERLDLLADGLRLREPAVAERG